MCVRTWDFQGLAMCSACCPRLFFLQFIFFPCATADCHKRATPFSCMVSPEPQKDPLHSVAREAVCAPLSAITNTNTVTYPECTAH
uniref:Putative secreted protein n=1 Tax=Ixodes ricinus TaxID=34613 RepID=A0A6B0UFA5_IXORI